MTTHVFIGVGPANLHRALKIKKIDPSAKLVFIDDRLRPETRDIDRVRARANIFRFENDEVTAKLFADGIKEEDLAPLIYQRDFSVAQGFQSGDDTVFTAKPFTQIQIRDLQLLLLKTLDDLGGENKPLLVAQKIGGHSTKSMEDEVAEILYKHRETLGLNSREKQNIKIHVATGALHGDAEKNEIVYPDKLEHHMEHATDDIEANPVTPLHGTTTFFIEQHITLDQLKENQRSLDLTEWAPALKEFGWKLVRPPRIRVFYANDILYIGAEIPINMMSMDKAKFEEQVTQYTRRIASLVFPGLQINSLPVNPHLRSRFPTARGERGDVLSTNPQKTLNWGGETIDANVTTLIHGDSRYLPHYQTGSGFVTAFLQNELYAEIYSRNSFAGLVEWGISNGKLPAETDVIALEATYAKQTNNDPILAVEAFQQELFMAFSRDIIEKNKEKVGRYFNAIHNQALNALSLKLDEVLVTYNAFLGTNLTREQFDILDPKIVVMHLLKVNHIGFLRKMLPQLLNMDFSSLSIDEIIHARDIHLLDFDKVLNAKDKFTKEYSQLVINTFKLIIDNYTKEDLDTLIKNLASGESSAFNKIIIDLRLPIIGNDSDVEGFRKTLLHVAITQRNSSNPFYRNMESLIKEENTSGLAFNLKSIAKTLNDNPILHQRSFLSIFTSKHSHTIKQFSKDIDNLVQKYEKNPEQLKTEALSTLLKFHNTLQQGSSRRTMEALMEITAGIAHSASQSNTPHGI